LNITTSILLNSYEIFIFGKSREEKALLEKLTTELTHKEEEFNKIDERLHILESDADKHQLFIRQLEEALEIQKSKNNVSSLYIDLKNFYNDIFLYIFESNCYFSM